MSIRDQKRKKKPEFWKSGSHAQAQLPMVKRGGKLESAPPHSSVLAGQRKEESETWLRSSVAPCAPACPGQQENKNEASSPKIFLYFSPLSFLPSPSSSLSLSPFPIVSHVWYFYHLISSFVPTHSITIIFLTSLPIDFPIWASKESYKTSWEET